MNWLAGGATALISLAVLLWGMLPPHVMETGQLDPRDWLLPAFIALPVLLAFLRWRLGGWRWPALLCAVVAVTVPPLLFCTVGSGPRADIAAERWAIWLHPGPSDYPERARRPLVGLLSGPVLHGPGQGGALRAGFTQAPLWQLLSRRFTLRPVDALDGGAVDGLDRLMLIQPRALAPEELVALDTWVRMGGHAILLVDPDLRWADERPLGHALRPPSSSLMSPLLTHWGIALAPAPPRSEGDPVERRWMDDGSMIQIAGASHFLPSHSRPSGGARCDLGSQGLVAHCTVGRGTAILVADADFANDALWTAEPQRPELMHAWTSDAGAFLAEILDSAPDPATGRRVWLARTDGLPDALRVALGGIVVAALAMLVCARTRPAAKTEKGRVSHPD